MSSLSKRGFLRAGAAGAAVLAFLLATTGLAAYPQQEVPPTDKSFTIGAVYTTMDTGYFFQGVRYQNYDAAFQRVLTRMAKDKGFGLNTYDVSADPGVLSTAVEELTAAQVGGALVLQDDPVVMVNFVKQLREKRVPMVLLGLRSVREVSAPYVGYDAVSTGNSLGQATAARFQELFPGKKARVLIANTQIVERNRNLQAGFAAGFLQVLPDAELYPVRDDQGSTTNTEQIIGTALTQHPDANVFVGMSDFRTIGIMNALRNDGRGTPRTDLVASVGGSEEAMTELLRSDSSWKVEAAVAVGDMARESYDLLRQVMTGGRPQDSRVEILVESQIMVQPTLEEVRQYLQSQRGITEFTPNP
jgi:ABC-type sugar transport system substrate-binding protein